MGNFDQANTLAQAERLCDLLVSFSTNGQEDNDEYVCLRDELIKIPAVSPYLPKFIKRHRNLKTFWSFIQPLLAHYEERRNFINAEFEPLLDFLESPIATPADKSISEGLQSFDNKGVHEIWGKALERRESDPAGAITMARTLLETVCKHILEAKEIVYEEKSFNLSKLYSATAKTLNLSPSQQSEIIFKDILGGCNKVINGLGNLRNDLGDAHGKGRKSFKPAPRHAELAVNLAGAVALFLVSTFNNNLKKELEG